MQSDKWKTVLNEYIRQGEPDAVEKSRAWRTAIGLQDVDGIKTSDYLLETAQEHIEGNIDIKTAQSRIHCYYKEHASRAEIEARTEEADVVSARITEILGEKAFHFSPAEYQIIHKRLFQGIFPHAGQFRDYNITKAEWVLNGESILYASADSIRATLDYDFEQEKSFSYAGISDHDAVEHLAKFTSGIWQIHPFGEGNTRATAVFILKYLRLFGFNVDNELFAHESWYFRNALVRANYRNLSKGITTSPVYLLRFFENLLLGYHNPLKNRYTHIDFSETANGPESVCQSANADDSKCKNCTLEELVILREIQKKSMCYAEITCGEDWKI